jgi:outer membrane lipoprotein-sorting protein
MDKILYKFMKIISIVLLSAVFIGWGDDWNQVKKGAVDINTVEARFVQEKQMEILTRPLVSRGMFYFRAPGSLRWEYTSPIHSILIMHGGTVTRYIKKGEAMVRDSSAGLQAMQIVLGDIARWTKGEFTANPGFSAELKKGRTVILSPRDLSVAGIIQRIVLRLADEPGVIRSVAIYETKKSYTLLEFSNVKLNAPIPDRLFTGP